MPTMRWLADWDQKSQFAGPTPYGGPHRVFGTYLCVNCQRSWSSAGSWADLGQQCRGCHVRILPHIQSLIRKRHPLFGWKWSEAYVEMQAGLGGLDIYRHHLASCNECEERMEGGAPYPCKEMTNKLAPIIAKRKPHDRNACDKCRHMKDGKPCVSLQAAEEGSPRQGLKPSKNKKRKQKARKPDSEDDGATPRPSDSPAAHRQPMYANPPTMGSPNLHNEETPAAKTKAQATGPTKKAHKKKAGKPVGQGAPNEKVQIPTNAGKVQKATAVATETETGPSTPTAAPTITKSQKRAQARRRRQAAELQTAYVLN